MGRQWEKKESDSFDAAEEQKAQLIVMV